jgi:hypothetical protein
VVNNTLDVTGLQIDGVEFDMIGHTAQVDVHDDYFGNVSIDGEGAFRTFEYDVNQSIKTAPNDTNPA